MDNYQFNKTLISLEHILQTNLSDDDITCISIPFYRHILKSKNELKQKPNNSKHYIQDILWNNKYFKTHGRLLKKTRKNPQTCYVLSQMVQSWCYTIGESA